METVRVPARRLENLWLSVSAVPEAGWNPAAPRPGKGEGERLVAG